MKKVTKKTAKSKKANPSPKAVKVQKPIGAVTHYYGGINVAIVKFKKTMKKGTAVRFSGATTDFNQTITSIQYDHKDIDAAPKGKEVGVQVEKKVREGDEVYE